MLIYLILVYISIFLSLLPMERFRRIRINQNICIEFKNFIFVSFSIALIIISSIRYGIGTDYIGYKLTYERGEFSHYDFAYRFMGNLFVFLKLHYQLMILFMTFLGVGSLLYVIKKSSVYIDMFLALFIFLSFNIYGSSFNYIRQFSALGLFILAVYYISLNNNNRYKGIILYIMAIGMHQSALIAIPFVLIIYSKLFNKQKIRYITVGVIIMYFLNPIVIISNLILKLIPFAGRFRSYLNVTGTFAERTFNSGASLTDRILFFPFIIVLTLIILDEKYFKNLTSMNQIMIKMFYLYNIIIGINIGSEILDRLLLFIYISCLWGIPLIVNYLKYKYSSFFAFLFKIFIISVGVFTIYHQLNGNVYAIVPYETFFGK